MTKEEKIKEAYKEHWESVKDYVNNDGWCSWKWCKPENIIIRKSLNEQSDGCGSWRPKSLEGLENNNGWIELIKNENIPSGYYWILYSNSDTPKMGISNGFSITQANLGLGLHPVIEITHYQPIIMPNERLY